MKTKNIVAALIIIISGLTVISSCKKYEDGPAFSLRTKKARLTGDWKISSVTYNDNDITSTFSSGFELDIEKDGTYKMMGIGTGTNITSDSGKWKFGEDKDDVYFTSSASGSVETAYRILRLKNTELWLRTTASNGDVTKYKLKQ